MFPLIITGLDEVVYDNYVVDIGELGETSRTLSQNEFDLMSLH